MHDPADNPPIIDPVRPGTVLRKQWIDHRPLPIAQPKLVRHQLEDFIDRHVGPDRQLTLRLAS